MPSVCRCFFSEFQLENGQSRSEAFAKEYDKKIFHWKDVQQALKPNEAAIEIIRFRKFSLQPIESINEVILDSSLTTMLPSDTINYTALIITPQTKDYPELVLLENGNDLEEKWLQTYQQRIRRKTAFELELDPDYNSYNQYWAKIGAKLKELGVKRVYLSPDGVYHQININTLINPETKQYILDELDVRLLTSTRDLISFRSAPEKSKPEPQPNQAQNNAQLRAELFGYPEYTLETTNAPQQQKTEQQSIAQFTPPKTAIPSNTLKEMSGEFGSGFDELPGAKAQIEAIAQTLKERKWSVVEHLDKEASEEAVKKLKSPYILHIATHGFFLPDQKDTTTARAQPMAFDADMKRPIRLANSLFRSGLALAGANNTVNDSLRKRTPKRSEDGILTAFEAMNLDLDDTELVDLSACETGLGEVKAGEGVYGLQRAFRVAGAKALIMSLRPVNDEATQKLMSTFYKRWAGGMPKQEAFRTAQQDLRKEYPTPYYWGGFVMLGE